MSLTHMPRYRSMESIQLSVLLVEIWQRRTHVLVMHAYAADDTERTNDVKRRPKRGAQANNLDDEIGAAPVGNLHDALLHALGVGLEIERLGTQLPRLLEPAVDGVDGEEVLGLELGGGQHGAEAHRPAADHDGRDVVALLHREEVPGGLGAEVARRPDVGHENEGAVGDGRGRPDERAVGVGDSDVLGLSAVDGGTAEELAILASGGKAVSAIETFRAAYCVNEWGLRGLKQKRK